MDTLVVSELEPKKIGSKNSHKKNQQNLEIF